MQTKKQTEKNIIICKAIWKFSRLFNKSQWPDNDTIQIYADLLENFEVEKITMAFSVMILKKKITFFPSCPEIVAEICPEESNATKAQLMSDNIFSAMARYGRGRYEEVKACLTSQEFQALELVGKNVVGESSGSSVTAVRYQIRNTCVALLELKHVAHKKQVMEKVSQNNTENVLEFKNIVKEFLPIEVS
jgi:hypothetical protein